MTEQVGLLKINTIIYVKRIGKFEWRGGQILHLYNITLSILWWELTLTKSKYKNQRRLSKIN